MRLFIGVLLRLLPALSPEGDLHLCSHRRFVLTGYATAMPEAGEREIEDLALVVSRLTQVAKILQ